jgi:hypothetical protein
MALIKCPKCGAEISYSADKCPKCAYQIGNVFKKVSTDEVKKEMPFVKARTFLIIVFIISIFVTWIGGVIEDSEVTNWGFKIVLASLTCIIILGIIIQFKEKK